MDNKYKERIKILEEHEKNAQYKQHLKGKFTARERLKILFDEDSFEEMFKFKSNRGNSSDNNTIDGDGVIVGHGYIQGRSVFAYAQDFTVQGGSLGHVHGEKIARIQEMAIKLGNPIVGLIDSGGARIQEGVESLAAYARIFRNNVQSSGIIPQISVILGPAAGGAVYSPSLTDFIIMTNKTSFMFLTGPDIVKEVLNEDVTFESLGGGEVHAEKSGVASLLYDDEENAILAVRKLLSYLPSNNYESTPIVRDYEFYQTKQELLAKLVPDDPNQPYDVKDIINIVMDKDSFFEIHENFAKNIVVGFARLEGKTIGVVANQPKVLAGTLDIDASVKGGRFVRFCDAFNIPLLVFEDVPGFLPGISQEHNGVIRHGAKLLYAFCEATIPKVTVILRKSYGGAYIVMNSKNTGGDFNFAWPKSAIAVMGPEGAVKIVNRKELAEADDPDTLKAELVKKYREEIANPYVSEEKGLIDEVIQPHETRNKVIRAFKILSTKQLNRPPRKHGNIPL